VTSAGNIKLGVEIDANDLSARLGEAVRRAIAPALAEIQRELNAVQREYDRTARAGEKSSAAQTAGAKAVSEAVEKVGEQQTKTASKTAAASGVSSRSINAVTRAIEKQTAAFDRNTAARAANAAAPTGGPPSGGGGGGPPGGGGSGFERHRGGFMQGGKGRFGFLTSPVGVNLIAGGISALAPAAALITDMVGGVQQLASAGLALPGIYGAAGASIGTAMLGFKGMGDAVKALTEAMKSNDPKDFEKAAEAMKDMDPAAQDVAKTVAGLTRGPLLDLQKMIQGRMFRDFAGDLQSTADKAIPAVSGGMGKIADAWNGTLKSLTGSLRDDRNLSLMDRILGNTAEGQNRMNKAIAPLSHALLTLTSGSTNALPRLADGLAAGAERFDKFITHAVESGDFDRWMNRGIDGLHELANTGLNLVKIITDVTKAAGSDQGGFLKWLDSSVSKLHDLTSSESGQNAMAKFFDDARESGRQWLPILENLAKMLPEIFNASQQWAGVLLPFLRVTTDLLTSMPGLLQAVLIGFLAYKTLSPFTGLLKGLGDLEAGLGRVSTKADTVGGKLGGGKGGGGRFGMPSGAGLIPLIGGIAAQPTDGTQPPSGLAALSALGGGALIGGEIAGPVGAAFGVAAAAAVQLAQVFINQANAVENAHQAMLDSVKNQPPAIPAINPNAPILPGPAVQPPPNISAPNPIPGPTTVKGLLLGPAAPVGSGNGGELRNLAGIDQALSTIGDKAAIAKANTDLLANSITTLPTGEVVLKDNTPEAIQKVKDLGYAVKTLPTGQVQIAVQYMLDGRPISHDQLIQPIRVPAVPGEVIKPGQHASGGAIIGGIPGKDSVLSWLMPGEHVLTTSDVAALGGQAGVYAMRQALHFADGGAVPGGVVPAIGPDTELGVLIQIRDLLAGKGGTASNPIAATAANTATVATAAKDGTGTGQQLGPFGTPIKPRHRGYEAAAAAISALGGDPEKWLGTDPATLPISQGGILPDAPVATTGGVPGQPGVAGAVDFNSIAAALAKFAMSGDLADVSGLGLNANSPVITAITSARNKKKGGLSDQQISDLTSQVIGGGYTGVLDESNSSLIKSLQRFRDQSVKKGGVPGTTTGTRGTAPVAGSAGVPMTPLGLDPVSAFAQSVSGGKYDWGASDLANGLSDCSGAVSDLVELITKGQAGPERLFDTHSAADVLTKLGATPGLIPGTLQIGFNSGHMAATLPNGVNFESGGGTGQGATYGGNAAGAGDKQFTQQFSLPIGNLPPGAYTSMSGLPGGAMAAAGGATPVFVTNWPGGGPGQVPPGVNALLGGATSGAQEAAGNVIGDVSGAIGSLGLEPWNTKNTKYAALNALVKERNPMALAKALGLDIPDFSQAGGSAGDLTTNAGPGFDATGRLFSDTSSLIDRTFTSLNEQLQAMRDQMVAVIEQTNEKLQDSALEPIVKTGVQSALEELKDSVSNAIGTAMGNAAAPPIADAVKSAVGSLPIDNSGAGGVGGAAASPVSAIAGGLFASGGPVSGGVPGKDSVPALLMPGEFVLNTADVARLGGHSTIDRIRSRGLRHFATGGGVIGNDTVGAEFFGVSEVPIVSTIVNLLVRVLLKVIGVEIEVRDTLHEMTDDFRSFRGDAFKAFDAQGRLLNDTSGLIERTQSSAETAAAERIRILKIVIQAIIKYIIEKVIVPITKAVANAAIQAGASAAGAAVNTQAPGAGGIVSSLISSAGQAGVDIAAEVGTDFALSLSQTLIDMTAEGLQSQFPDLMTGIFSGGALATFFDPAGGFMGNLIGGLMGAFTALLGGGVFGGAATMIPGDSLFGGLGLFDDGGMASGTGFLPKASVGDELVLSPVETDLFSRFVGALERGGFGGGGSKSVHAPITVIGGGPETAQQVQDRLLKLIP